MRTMWTGSISFGLVNIPIRLYSGTDEKNLNFEYLHKKDLSPVRYAKMCKTEGKEIPYSEIVRGYEYEKGYYVVLDEKDFEKARVKGLKTIDIVGFSKEGEVDSVYFEKPYYLEPDKGADKAYALLREALKKSKKVGIAKFVLRNRENLALIKPEGDLLVLNQLRFSDELRSAKELKLPEPDVVSEKEIKMALALIDQLSEPFKIKEFKDTYKEELKRVIKEKSEGKVTKKPESQPQPTQVKDLMTLLRASLDENRKVASA